VALPEPALAMLHERTEGWAAGLRLAALSLAGHEDPERFAAEFSGSERTVADYLLAEMLERQPDEVRRLLLRTSVLERVSGPLADALTGGSGGERTLAELEQANAFVVSLDAERSWFRYHHLFADLLQLALRRTTPGEVTALHEAAAGWFAEHGFPVQAIRHAQAAQDWALAARLLADNWPGLYLSGQAATVHALLAGFPAEATAADAELATVVAADELAQGSLEEAERYLRLAERGFDRALLARGPQDAPGTARADAAGTRDLLHAGGRRDQPVGDRLRAGQPLDVADRRRSCLRHAYCPRGSVPAALGAVGGPGRFSAYGRRRAGRYPYRPVRLGHSLTAGIVTAAAFVAYQQIENHVPAPVGDIRNDVLMSASAGLTPPCHAARIRGVPRGSAGRAGRRAA